MANTAAIGGATLSPVPTTLPYGTQLQEYAAGFDGELGSGYGQAFLNYASAHAYLSAKQAATGFADIVASESVGGSIAEGVSSVAQSNAVIGSSVANSVDSTSAALSKIPGNPLSGLDAIGNFFNLLTQRQTLIRIAEGVLGLLLVVAAIAKLADGTPAGKVAGNIAKKAAIS